MKNEEAIEILEAMAMAESTFTDEESKKCCEAIDLAVEALKREELSSGEPLTLEQLREMDGKLVGIGDANGNVSENAIVNAVARFSLGRSGVLYLFEYYGKTWFAYAYPSANIDWEAWTGCVCNNGKKNCCTCISLECHSCIGESKYKKGHYCSSCGRPLEEA